MSEIETAPIREQIEAARQRARDELFASIDIAWHEYDSLLRFADEVHYLGCTDALLNGNNERQAERVLDAAEAVRMKALDVRFAAVVSAWQVFSKTHRKEGP